MFGDRIVEPRLAERELAALVERDGFAGAVDRGGRGDIDEPPDTGVGKRGQQPERPLVDDVMDRRAGDLVPAAQPGEMNAGITALDRAGQAERIEEIAAHLFDRESAEPADPALGADETADLVSVVEQPSHGAGADEAGTSRDQNPHRDLPQRRSHNIGFAGCDIAMLVRNGARTDQAAPL